MVLPGILDFSNDEGGSWAVGEGGSSVGKEGPSAGEGLSSLDGRQEYGKNGEGGSSIGSWRE